MVALSRVYRSIRRRLPYYLSLSPPSLVSPSPNSNLTCILYSQTHSCTQFTTFRFNFLSSNLIVGKLHQLTSSQKSFFSAYSTLPQTPKLPNSGKQGDNDNVDRLLKLNSKIGTSWVDLYLPQRIRPYAKLARLDRPIGTWLLAWPCMWYDVSFPLSLFFCFIIM